MWSPVNALSALVQHTQGSIGNNSELAQQQQPRWVLSAAACNDAAHGWQHGAVRRYHFPLTQCQAIIRGSADTHYTRCPAPIMADWALWHRPTLVRIFSSFSEY